jgi:hypothetical protein
MYLELLESSWGRSSVVEHLPIIHETLVSIPSIERKKKKIENEKMNRLRKNIGKQFHLE